MPNKPVLQYQAELRPLSLDGNVAIVRKMVDESTYVNWADKTELTDFIDLFYVPPTSDTYLLVTCQCGTPYVYSNKAEVPDSNVTCACGRKIIEYGI